jgi:hypothetical protein
MEERMTDQRRVEHESQEGYERELADYEQELARYLQARIKPGLSRGAIPLLARSVAKEIAGQEPPEQIAGSDAPEAGGGPVAGFEADMHELQAELGDDWILRFSVHGGDGWLTAEKQDSTQRVAAATAEQLVRIVEAIDARGDDGAAPEGKSEWHQPHGG